VTLLNWDVRYVPPHTTSSDPLYAISRISPTRQAKTCCDYCDE
ncbi:uncharacterized protein METZ01_LOCUS175363, partial [marine metagenome]